MKPSKIIIAFHDKSIGCEINDPQGHILDYNNLSKSERLQVINALDSLHQLFLKHLNH